MTNTPIRLKKGARPRSVLVHVSENELQALKDAAAQGGIAMSSWMRMALLRQARLELSEALGRPVTFTTPVGIAQGEDPQ